MEIFIPLWVLSFINLAVYYQDSNVLSEKIASIATVTLAFVAFLPTINDRIPQTSMVKLVEIIVYLQIGTTFLTLIDALEKRKLDPAHYETVWSSNPYFMITLLINLICFIIVIALLILHKVWWEKVYTQERDEKITGKLNRMLWVNEECDEEFKKAIVSNKIVTVPPEFEKIKSASERSQKY